MATSKNPSKNCISFEDFQELLTRPYVNPSCLLPSKPELNEFYLGPSFNDADSIGQAAVAQLFPCTQEPPFLDPFSLKPIRDKSIRTWPKNDTTFHLWHARMMKHIAKISDLLEIAIRPPVYDPILFSIALSFWSSEYNTIIFPLSSMSITLRDVGALVNLPPLGDTISPVILISSSAPKFDKRYIDFFPGMQELYNNSGSKPTHAERVAFLQVWLCRYVLCVPSLKHSMAYLPIAHEQAHDRSLNRCSLVLATFYRGMAYLPYQLRTNASLTGSGPLWLAQLWLRAYFPQFVHQIPIYVQPPLTLNEVSDVLPFWAQYLIGRELFHNILTGTNAKAGVEVYAPQFFARQLGFGQTWSIPPCYSKSFQERFHTITKVEAQTIHARNASLMNGFSLAPFNPTTIVHLLIEQFWPSVKRRFFPTNVNHLFHLLEGLGSSRTYISSIPDPIPAVPISIRRPAPFSSRSKSPLIRTRRSAMCSLQFSSPPAQTKVIIGVSSRKRPALGSSDRPDDNSDDDDDDAPPLIKRNRGSISPLKDSTPPIPSSPLPSVPSNKEILPEKELEGPETSIAQTVGESSPFQGVLPSSVELEEIPIDLPVVQEPIRPYKDESSQAVESLSDILSHSSSRSTDATDEPTHEILPPPIPSSPLPSVPSNKEILPEKELEGPETSIAQTVGESSPFQGVLPSSVELEEIPIDLPVVQEPIRPFKDESSQAVESLSDILSHSSSRATDATDEPTHEDLFTSWEQAKVSHVVRSSSASGPSAASTAFSIENMNILKQAVFEYTSFMDMDIVNASATSQRDKFEHLSNQMAQALELPSLKLPTDLKLSLKIIHQEISALLAKNVELKAKKTQYFNAVTEKESLYHEIDKAKSILNEISSDIMVKDTLMMSLATQMKEIQAKMDDCKARLAAKKCNPSQEVERAKSLLEHYSNLEVDEGIMDELSTTSIDQRDEWEKLREQMRSIWGKIVIKTLTS
ncbi:PMD domain-containing protein [Abeliophyllum distichum]|uniref:PMD domain-containing protein n=1 Tax=Abeliophyllum distichum TaxID=126358 RepID=A0ABD1QHL7_9LAMI